MYIICPAVYSAYAVIPVSNDSVYPTPTSVQHIRSKSVTFRRFLQLIAPLLVFCGIFLVWLGLESLDRLLISVPMLCGGVVVGGIGVWQAQNKIVVILFTLTVAIVAYMAAVVYWLSRA